MTKMVLKGLLVCGILSSLLYVAMNVFVPMLFEGYSLVSQTVSELSAIGERTMRGGCGDATSVLRYIVLASPRTRMRAAAQPLR